MKVPYKVISTVTALFLLSSTPVFAHGNEDEESKESSSHNGTVELIDGIHNKKVNITTINEDNNLYIPLDILEDIYGISSEWDDNQTTLRLKKNEQSLTSIKYVKKDNETYLSATDLEKLLKVEVIQNGADVYIDNNRVTSNENLIYFPNGTGNAVSIVNWLTGKVEDVVTSEVIPGAENSHGSAINKDGTELFVSSMNQNAVSVFNLKENRLVTKVDVGFKTHHMESDPLGRYIYVTELKGSKVAIIDAKTHTLVNTFVSGKGAYMPVSSPDGKYLYVANIMDNGITIYNLDEMKVLKKVNLQDAPFNLTSTVDQMVHEVLEMKFANEYNSISKSQRSSNAKRANQLRNELKEMGADIKYISRDVPVKEASFHLAEGHIKMMDVMAKKPSHLAVDPENGNVYVTNSGSKTISVLTSTGELLNELQVQEEPHGIVVTKDKVFVANSSSDSLSVIDKNTNAVLSFQIGKEPGHIEITPDGKLLLQLEGDKQLLVINENTLQIEKSINLLSDGHQISIN